MQGIKQLAQHLQISIGTVSRALNGKPDVSPETRQRVLEAAEAMGYVANQSGRSLRQGTTNAIGFMIELGEDTNASSDNFFLGVFQGVKRQLTPHGLDLVVLPAASEDDRVSFLRRIVGRRLVDGMILSATQRRDPRIEMLLEAKVPFITLGRSETAGPYPWIDLDFEGYLDQSVARLVAFGHKRIDLAVSASGINLRYVLQRRFKRAMARHGLSAGPDQIHHVRSVEEGSAELCDQLLNSADPPTAVILSYELMAVGLYRRMHELGLRPGRDLSIIGLRESAQSRGLRPSLTSYRLDLVELGEALAAGLVEDMQNRGTRKNYAPLQRLWPMELVPGQSDGPLVT